MTMLLLILGVLNPTYLEPYKTFLGQVILLALAAFYVVLMAWARNLAPAAASGPAPAAHELAGTLMFSTPFIAALLGGCVFGADSPR